MTNTGEDNNLARLANQGKAELLTRLRGEREKQHAAQGTLPDSTADIRAEREARW